MSPLNGNGHSNCISGGGGNVNGSKNYIEHHVSKMDTLAGVAIKYGVEVADIKRLNGLATDLQMFALKKLLIPLPGRHPPSSVQSSASDSLSLNKSPQHPRYSNVLDSLESLRLKPTQPKVSPAMSSLREFYGLKSSNHKAATEGTEMAVYRTTSSDYLKEGLLSKTSPFSGSPYRNLNSRNTSNGFLADDSSLLVDYVPLAEAGDAEVEKSNEKSVRRRQKSEADFRGGTPEKFLREENSGGSSDFSPVTGKGLAMRPKSASRAVLSSETESGWLNSIPVGMGDSIISDGLSGVRKSSSTPSLHEQDNTNNFTSVWPSSKWSLKPDLLSTATINLPIFDGLPKPISGRRSKAALD